MAIDSHMTRRMGEPSGFKRSLIWGIVFIIVVFALVYVHTRGGFPDRTSQTQAVFLDNGQVYFGSIDKQTRDYVRLEGVYYLEVRQDLQGSSVGDGLGSALVKLGNELHGPEDFMDINTAHILFIEDLKDDSKVVSAIRDHQSNN